MSGKTLAGSEGQEDELLNVSLLDEVAGAAEKVREAETQRRVAQELLRQRIRTARDEGVTFSAIARAANLSHERVRQLYAGR